MDYYIIYPRGDRSKINIIQTFSYEKDDYALASKRVFSESEEYEVIKYAKCLAEENNKVYVGPEFNEDSKHDYLD